MFDNFCTSPFLQSDLLLLTGSKHNFKNIVISKSKNVHLGNKTYIYGPVYLNQNATMINQHTTINNFISNNHGN